MRESLPEADSFFQIESVESCDSTNARLLARSGEGAASGLVLVADRQTAGRGRMGRAWASMPETSLTFSLLWRFSPAKISGLSLAVGLALLNALKKLGANDLALKWPNDLLHAPPGKMPSKIAGILVEIAPGNSRAEMSAVIGIGLNLSAPQGLELDMPAAGLVDCMPVLLPRARILAAVLAEIRQTLSMLESKDFAALREDWQACHFYQNQEVCLLTAAGVADEGICRGVNEEGALLLEKSGASGAKEGSAELFRFFAGDLSLRAKAAHSSRGIYHDALS